MAIPGINEARVRPLVDVGAGGAAADLVAVLLHELGQTQYLQVQCPGPCLLLMSMHKGEVWVLCIGF